MSTIINDKREAQRQEEKTYHVGQWFIDNANYLCILCPVGTKMVVLVNPRESDAFYYGDPIKVQDLCKITQQEFNKITGGDRTFTQVQVEINIIKNL